MFISMNINVRGLCLPLVVMVVDSFTMLLQSALYFECPSGWMYDKRLRAEIRFVLICTFLFPSPPPSSSFHFFSSLSLSPLTSFFDRVSVCLEWSILVPQPFESQSYRWTVHSTPAVGKPEVLGRETPYQCHLPTTTKWVQVLNSHTVTLSIISKKEIFILIIGRFLFQKGYCVHTHITMVLKEHIVHYLTSSDFCNSFFCIYSGCFIYIYLHNM